MPAASATRIDSGDGVTVTLSVPIRTAPAPLTVRFCSVNATRPPSRLRSASVAPFGRTDTRTVTGEIDAIRSSTGWPAIVSGCPCASLSTRRNITAPAAPSPFKACRRVTVFPKA